MLVMLKKNYPKIKKIYIFPCQRFPIDLKKKYVFFQQQKCGIRKIKFSITLRKTIIMHIL